MNFERIFIGITTLCYAFFIFSYPPSFYNDDSLYLANGIEYFSVIDFSPHFPGYPALIILGKFINFFIADAKMSLFILTATCAILTPLIIYLLVEDLLNNKAALIAFILTLSSPYLLNLSLTMLSDSVGLFFFFLGLYLLQKRKYKSCGFILSVALFCRPSYIIFYFVGLIYLIIYKKESIKPMLRFFFLGLVLFLLFIFINEGTLYLSEAKRFISGHFNLWGTGQNSEDTWGEQLFNLTNLIYILLFFVVIYFDRRLKLYYALFISYFIWILFAQNPDNLRHLIPLILFANILLASWLSKKTIFISIAVIFYNFSFLANVEEKISPLENIVKVIQKQNNIIITNRGIEVFRKYQHNTVVDKYYLHSSNFINKNKKSKTIDTSKPKKRDFMEFKGRFIGEKTLYLF